MAVSGRRHLRGSTIVPSPCACGCTLLRGCAIIGPSGVMRWPSVVTRSNVPPGCVLRLRPHVCDATLLCMLPVEGAIASVQVPLHGWCMRTVPPCRMLRLRQRCLLQRVPCATAHGRRHGRRHGRSRRFSTVPPCHMIRSRQGCLLRRVSCATAHACMHSCSRRFSTVPPGRVLRFRQPRGLAVTHERQRFRPHGAAVAASAAGTRRWCWPWQLLHALL